MGSIPEPILCFVLGGVRIGIGCMNLVTVISRYTRVPVTLKQLVTNNEVKAKNTDRQKWLS